MELNPEAGALPALLLALLLGLLLIMRILPYHVAVSPACNTHGVRTFFRGLRGYGIQKNEKENGEYKRSPLTQQSNR